MALTPETLPRHELVGLRAEVVEATDPGLVGAAGEVVRETTKLLELAGERVRQVPKAAATFRFALPEGPCVRVTGERLVGRPAERSEDGGDPIWR
jgi:ribonuclease P protein subunit POP4